MASSFSREDWIILRLLMVGVDTSPRFAHDVAVTRAVSDLIKRRGTGAVNDAIDAIHAERLALKESTK